MKKSMPIVVIAGKMCAGKSTVAGEFRRLFWQLRGEDGGKMTKGFNPKMVKYADPMYQTQDIFGNSKNRAFLQGLGALVRDCYGVDKFIKIFEASVAEAITKRRPVICDDLRHQVEYDALNSMGAGAPTIIWVESSEDVRKKRGESLGTWSNTNHVSEGGLDINDTFHHVLWNDGSKDDLKNQVEAIYANLASPEEKALLRPSQSLSQYDAIEVSPVAISDDGGCETVIGKPALADIWSVYLRLATGGAECIGDFPVDQVEHALRYADVISRNMGWPVCNNTKRD